MIDASDSEAVSSGAVALNIDRTKSPGIGPAKPPSPVQIRAAPPKFKTRLHPLFVRRASTLLRDGLKLLMRTGSPPTQDVDWLRVVRAHFHEGGGLDEPPSRQAAGT